MKMETPPVGLKKPTLGSLSKTSLTPCRRLGLSRPSPGNLKRSLDRVTPNKNYSTVQSTISNDKNSITKPDTDTQKTPLRTSDSLNKSAPLKAKRCLTKDHTPMIKSKKTFFTEVKNSNLCKSQESLVSSLFKNNVSKEEVNNSCKKRKLNLKQEVNKNIQNKDSNISSSNPICSDGEQEISIVQRSPNSLNNFDEEITPGVIEKLITSIKEKKKRLEVLKVQETYAKKHNIEELRAQTEKWTAAGKEALRYSVSLARSSGHNVTIKELMNQHGFPKQLMGYNSEDDEFE